MKKLWHALLRMLPFFSELKPKSGMVSEYIKCFSHCFLISCDKILIALLLPTGLLESLKMVAFLLNRQLILS